MKYEDELLETLDNIVGHLEHKYVKDLENPYAPSYAFSQAIDFSKSDDFHKRILGLIVFHQISIELIKRLLHYCNFLEKICLYPNKIDFKTFKKNSSYSQFLEEFKFKVDFSGKKKLIQKIIELNKLRTKYAHQIVLDDSLYYPEETYHFPKMFKEIFDLFTKGLIDLNKRIDQAKKRPEILKLIQARSKA